MGNLEKFIQKNREAFDDEMPGLQVWAKIDRQLERKRKVRRLPLYRVLTVAASVVVLLAAGAYIGTMFSKETPLPALAAVNEKPVLPEKYREVENFYRHQYEQKINMLANFQVDPTFREDLRQFEDVMNELKEELKKAPKGNEERIISAIIQNYQMKVEILQRVLDRIQTENPNSTKSKGNEISL